MSIAAVEQEHGDTPRELFFDLVFVFAFTQVATLRANDPTFAGVGRSVLVLAALWWAWSAFAWLTNIVDPEQGFVGAALLVALIAMFVAALVVPGVFEDEGVIFGVAFLVVCAMHAALYALSRGRLVAAIVLLLLLPVATTVPTLAALALVTAVWIGLHTYELVWWREARRESRSALAS
jgi:low temperature requirement protein LtrA